MFDLLNEAGGWAERLGRLVLEMRGRLEEAAAAGEGRPGMLGPDGASR